MGHAVFESSRAIDQKTKSKVRLCTASRTGTPARRPTARSLNQKERCR